MKFKFIGTILLVFLHCAVFAQTKKITGVVRSAENSERLEGVSIAVKGTSTYSMSVANGEFSLEVSVGDIVQFSLDGKEATEIVVDSKGIYEVVMNNDATQMRTVVKVTFGEIKADAAITSMKSISVTDLKQPTSNLTNSLAGRAAGVISMATTGEPGADNSDFFIRGVTTFGYKTEPLILVDGFEVTKDDLARISPDDIQDFAILKDAAATAMYGARSANGIVMVSTKMGREGPARITARLDYIVAMPTTKYDLVDGVQYMKLYNEARISRSPILGAYYSEQKIQSTAAGLNPMIFPNIDWYDQLFKSATTNMKANVNVSGGGTVAKYYVSGGYENETGILRVDKRNNFNNNIDIDRFNIRTNVVFKITNTTTLDTRIQGRFTRTTGPFRNAGDIFRMVMNANPVDFPAVYEPDAANQYTEHILFGNTFVTGSLKENPYAELVRGYKDDNDSRIIAQATLGQKLDFITKGLEFTLKGSISNWSFYGSRREYLPFYYDLDSYDQITEEYSLYSLNPTGGRPYLGDVASNRDATMDYYYEANLNWSRPFGLHTTGVRLVGIMQENLITGGNSASIYETLPERNMGVSGRATYDYDNRYFAEFSFSYNGSEKFAGDKKYGFFPSFAVGWILSNEKFYGESLKNALSLVKLRGSFGWNGNDAISGRGGRFFYLSDVALRGGNDAVRDYGYRWGQDFMTAYGGYTVNRYANPDISWEKSQKANIGLELGFLKKRQISVEVEYYQENRSSIYLTRENFPQSAGLEANISGNVGEVFAHGFDGSFTTNITFNKDLWLQGYGNFTYATNEYKELDERNYPDEYKKRKGHNINQRWGLVAERLFVDEAEIKNSPKQDFGAYMAGDIKYKDINGDGVVNSNDEVPLGNPGVPEIQYGFGFTVGYKKIDLSVFFQGNARSTFFINSTSESSSNAQGIAPFANRRNALSIVAKDYWSETAPNVHAFWPRLSVDPMDNNTRQSSWWMRNGSFLRLKTMELGYNFGGFDKIGLQKFRLYFSAENIFVISPFKLWDPELKSNGLSYPLNRKFQVGVLLNF